MKTVRNGFRALSVSAPLFFAGCATTGATFGSGVGDAYPEHPPFYAGGAEAVSAGGVGWLRVLYQRGASQPAIFDPSLSDAFRALLDDMDRSIASMGIGPRVVEGGGISAVAPVSLGVPPDVMLGCVTESLDPEGDCAEREGEALGRGFQPMRLAVGRPSPEWVSWIGEIMDANGVEHVVVLTVEIGQYWIRQRGLRGTKVVELGTDYEATFPWLTSLETQVAVVQLTGALVGRDGKAVRIGAEGMLPKRTPLVVSSLGAQALVTEADIEELRAARREDLPGRPLVWAVALKTLVERLTGGW